MLQDNITELSCEEILQNYIPGSYYRIILENHIMELDYGIIFIKRIPGVPGTSPEPPGILGISEHAPGTLGTPLGSQGTPLGSPRDVPETLGTPLGRPRDAPGTPQGPLGTPYGQQKRSYLDTYTAPEALNCVFEPASWDPLHEALDRALLSIKSSPKSKKVTSGPGILPRLGQEGSGPYFPGYIYIYIYSSFYFVLMKGN